MNTHDPPAAVEAPQPEAKDEASFLAQRKPSGAHRISVLVIDRTRLAREALAYFLQGWAPDLNVHGIEEIADAMKQQLEPPDVVLVALKVTHVDQAVVRQTASGLEAAFGKKVPTVIILQGEGAALDELDAVRLGMQGCFPASLGICMLIAAIRLVSSGGVFLSPQAISLLASWQNDSGNDFDESADGA